MLKTIITATLAATFAFGAAGTASAQGNRASQASMRVSLAGLNLNTDAGAHEALYRIRDAAEQICGGAPSSPLERRWTFDPCVKRTVDATVAQLGNTHVALIAAGASQVARAQ